MPQKSRKTFSTVIFKLMPTLAGLMMGALIMFLINKFILYNSDTYDFVPSKLYKERLESQIRDGGAQSKGDAETFTSAYRTYLASKEPTEPEFNKKYIAGTWYTMSEIENYFEVIKDASGLKSDEIRVYVCPGIYPTGTQNPINSKDVGDKFTGSLIFFKTPFNILPTGATKLNLKGNANCLGVYNWGDLEP